MAAGARTPERMVEAAFDILAENGAGALTFEAVARRLGVTKQAVIYWFPTKQDLLRAVVLPVVEAEVEAVVRALAGSGGAADAVGRAVTAIVRFHTADLARFRQMYLATQTDPRPTLLLDRETLDRVVHPVTSRMYGAIEAALAADPDRNRAIHPRRAAVLVHSSALGLVLMAALGEAVGDPLAHATADLAETLTALLTHGAAGS